MPPIAIAGGLMAAGSVGGALLNKSAADKQTKAANAALQMQIEERQRYLDLGLKTAALSPEEIRSINNMIANQGMMITSTLQSLQKQQATLDAMEPNVKVAGEELYKLLSGETSKMLAPLQSEFKRNKKEMENRMASEMGPGWRTSTAGMEAMARFEAQAALATMEAQNKAIQTASSVYSGLSGQQITGQQNITGSTSSLYRSAADVGGNIFTAYSREKDRQMNAITGSLNAPVNFTAPTQYAGGGERVMGNMFSNIGEFGMGLIGQQFGPDFGGSTGGNVFNTGNMRSTIQGPIDNYIASRDT